jgi:hypothetical protein
MEPAAALRHGHLRPDSHFGNQERRSLPFVSYFEASSGVECRISTRFRLKSGSEAVLHA